MRIKFFQLFDNLAKIEGIMSVGGDCLDLEMAMTRGGSENSSRVLKRSVAFVDLEDIVLVRRFWGKLEIELVARNLEALARVPGASGFKYRVTPTASKKEVRSFATEVRLGIAQAAMDKFTEQIESDLGR